MKTLLIAVLTALLLISSHASANDPNTAHGWPCELLIRVASAAHIERQKGAPKEPLLQLTVATGIEQGLTNDQLFGAALMVEYAYQVPINGQQEMVRGIIQHCQVTP